MQEERNDQSNNDYIEAIKKLKENTVDKEEYIKLKQENKQLLDNIVNGRSLPENQVEVVEAKESIEDLRESYLKEDNNNLQVVEKALRLRSRLMEEGEPDPFLPKGKDIIVTEEDRECAERVARVFQECVDYADGDSNIFTNELMRRTIDSAPNRRI